MRQCKLYGLTSNSTTFIERLWVLQTWINYLRKLMSFKWILVWWWFLWDRLKHFKILLSRDKLLEWLKQRGILWWFWRTNTCQKVRVIHLIIIEQSLIYISLFIRSYKLIKGNLIYLLLNIMANSFFRLAESKW